MTERAIAKEIVRRFPHADDAWPGLAGIHWIKPSWRMNWAAGFSTRWASSRQRHPRRSRKIANPPRGAGIHRQRLPGISRAPLVIV